MNHRGFLSLSLLAPVAGVMAARSGFAKVSPSGANMVFADELHEFRPLFLSAADAKFSAMWRFQIEEICRIFRVPPSAVLPLRDEPGVAS